MKICCIQFAIFKGLYCIQLDTIINYILTCKFLKCVVFPLLNVLVAATNIELNIDQRCTHI